MLKKQLYSHINWRRWKSKIDYKYRTQIYTLNTEGKSTPQQLTFDKDATRPVGVPDGQKIAFNRLVDDKMQVLYSLWMAGWSCN
jgi:Tol biopolymer transport system component